MTTFLLAVVLAFAQSQQPQPEETPTFTTADTSPTGGVTGQADATLEQALEDPGRYLVGASHMLEGLRIRDIEKIEGASGLYCLGLSEPRTGAYAPARARIYSSTTNFLFRGRALHEALRAEPKLAKVPIRIRYAGRAVTVDGRPAYEGTISSIEFIDENGRAFRTITPD